MCGGGGESTGTPYAVDPNQLSSFIQTGQGQKYKDLYNPGMAYAQFGDSVQAYDPNAGYDLGHVNRAGYDVSAMIGEFHQWQQSNAQTQQNWQNYATAVSANSGGQGDNAISVGPAVSQRKVLLGALANGGTNPTTPTPGLGTLGAASAGGGS